MMKTKFLLGDIPVLNYLFKYETESKEVQELVIIVEPHIIHKEKNSISLSDLGYEGIGNNILDDEYAAKKHTKELKKTKETNTTTEKEN